MRRRDFIVGAISAAAVSRAAAQPSANNPRLAIVSVGEPSALMHEQSENRYYRVLFAELRRLGHVEGQNLTVERYGTEQSAAGLAAVVAEVVRSNPDVVYVLGPGTLIFKRETTRIPIVAMTADPIGQGLIENLARPGGNITGVSVDTGPSIHGKRIELLREIHPATSKLACLMLRGAWDNIQGAALRAASDAAHIPLVSILLDLPTSEAAYRNAVADVARNGANAIMVGDSPDAMTNRSLIATLIGEARIPAIYPLSELVDAGGLMAYSYDLTELNKRVANDIDAILRGAMPGEIPFYQGSNYHLSLNLKTAKVLGLTVPATLLASADRIIE